MNNVQSIFGNNKPVFSTYGTADFDIAVSPLKYLDKSNTKILTSSKNVIYRTDTGEELGVHGSRYVAVPPKKLIDASRSIILQSDLDTDGVVETIRTSHNGSRTFVKYDLPHHNFTTPDGDTATLSLLSITSFDGTWAFMMSAGAIQHACTNLQVFTSGEVAVYKSKHTQGLNVNHASKIITNSLTMMKNENKLWEKYISTKINEQDAFDVFVSATNTQKTISNNYLDFVLPEVVINELPRENKALTYMWNVYKNRYAPTLGNNLWSVYNAMTDWATHAEVSKRSKHNEASVQHKRQEIVRKTAQKTLMKMVA